MAGGDDVAGAGAGLIGGALGTGLSFLGASNAWKRQKKVLQRGIQWKVKDLRAAGLNPILAAGGGLGGGSAPSVATPQTAQTGSDIQKGRSTSADVGLKKQQRSHSARQIALIDEQILNTRSQTGVNSALTTKHLADAQLSINSVNWRKPFGDIGKNISRFGTSHIGGQVDMIPAAVRSIMATNAHEFEQLQRRLTEKRDRINRNKRNFSK